MIFILSSDLQTLIKAWGELWGWQCLLQPLWALDLPEPFLSALSLTELQLFFIYLAQVLPEPFLSWAQSLPELFFVLGVVPPAMEAVSDQDTLKVHHGSLAAFLEDRHVISPARQRCGQDLVTDVSMDLLPVMNLMLPTRLPNHKCISEVRKWMKYEWY